jgi:hypothetical protein
MAVFDVEMKNAVIPSITPKHWNTMQFKAAKQAQQATKAGINNNFNPIIEKKQLGKSTEFYQLCHNEYYTNYYCSHNHYWRLDSL